MPSRNEAAVLSLNKVTKTFASGIKAVADLSLYAAKGEFLSLLGPSGCGKTTLLRLVAGLEAPNSGDILVNGVVVAGSAWVEPEKRGVGIVFQDYALFPHMTAAQNIAFGLRGQSRRQIQQRTGMMLEMVGIPNCGDKYPHELSGGQQQRIALARALAPAPRVMLLDEPFSNLDADLRFEIGTETRAILKETGTTAILVTHDQEEAFSLSDRVGVLNEGRLEQVGTPYEVYHTPATRFAANFVGRADFLPGRIEGGAVVSELGVFSLPQTGFSNATDVDLMVRPDDVDFELSPDGDALIVETRFLGPDVIYELRLPNKQVVHSIKPSTNAHAVGNRVKIKIDPVHVIVFPAAI